MTTKDFTRWNYDTLLEIVEGPLLNHKRLEEAIRVSRFIRRLMSFFHPFSHRFSDIVKTPVRSMFASVIVNAKYKQSTVKWVRLGCSLLNTLMKSPEGAKYLSNEDQFLVQIVKAFAQLDPVGPRGDTYCKTLLNYSSSMVCPIPILYFLGNAQRKPSPTGIWKYLEHSVNTKKGLSMYCLF